MSAVHSQPCRCPCVKGQLADSVPIEVLDWHFLYTHPNQKRTPQYPLSSMNNLHKQYRTLVRHTPHWKQRHPETVQPRKTTKRHKKIMQHTRHARGSKWDHATSATLTTAPGALCDPPLCAHTNPAVLHKSCPGTACINPLCVHTQTLYSQCASIACRTPL